MRYPVLRPSLVAAILISCSLALLTSGCEGEKEAGRTVSDQSVGADQGGACQPGEAGWEEAEAALTERCGTCHGETPAFGAPQTLMNREALLEGPPGGRLIDRALERIAAGEMPPAGQAPMSTLEREALYRWATCGEERPAPAPPGLEVDRPRFIHAGEVAESWSRSELRADAEVTLVDDQYRCFSFEGPGEEGETRYIRRIEPLIDDTRVVHHIVLYEVAEGDGGGAEQQCGAGLEGSIYAWAPGAGALQFPEGGLVTDSTRRYLIEVHYNNRAAYEGVRDRSGVRIFHSAPEGPAIDMLVLGPDGFILPPESRTEVGGICEIEEPLKVVAMLPHMHELGVSLRSEIIRADGERESMINLSGWDFDFQVAYDAEGLEFAPGDRIETHCIFENNSTETRRHGPNTDDEMCYHFTYVTPPPSQRRCDAPIVERSYAPGECAPAGITEWAGEARGTFNEGAAPQPPLAASQRPAPGEWRLVGSDLYFESLNLGVAVADPTRSTTENTGGLTIGEDGSLSFDTAGESVLVTDRGATFNREVAISFAGAAMWDEASRQLSLSLSCPNEGEQVFPYALDEGGDLWLYLSFTDPVEGTQVFRFSRKD